MKDLNKNNNDDWDLLSDCCKAYFNPLGFERDDGLWQEQCLKCGKPCEPIYTEKHSPEAHPHHGK